MLSILYDWGFTQILFYIVGFIVHNNIVQLQKNLLVKVKHRVGCYGYWQNLSLVITELVALMLYISYWIYACQPFKLTYSMAERVQFHVQHVQGLNFIFTNSMSSVTFIECFFACHATNWKLGILKKQYTECFN